ncbi:uncharacterized protein At5g01610-like [Rutidosis leptorrhynchoides]|uniref:uncharacterized protein At5g01610-like n=1 Tax=Rutidosis leptorrhynchoides TaxID=125765 RepID=UPI003A997437
MATSHVSLVLLALLAFSASASAIPTIYEILTQYGFPVGVLPDSVTSYVADEATGTFEIYLAKSCTVKYDYLVSFDTKITGKISYGHITELKGLKAQSLWFWLTVDEIKVDTASLQFTLGLVKVNIDIAEFETIPTCKANSLAANCNHRYNLINPLPSSVELVDKVTN